MGFLDNVSNSLNRGVNTVSRSGKTAQLNMQINELMKQRQNMAAQLGASLYDITKGNPAFTAGREPLYNGIASIDAQRASLEAQIEQIKAEQAAETAAAQTYRCPNCGSVVSATDLFCRGCGLPLPR
jgi:predicted  nucleic acid-binding Zn-ribbon protein